MGRFLWRLWNALVAGEAHIASWLRVKGRYKSTKEPYHTGRRQKADYVTDGEVIDEPGLPFPVVYYPAKEGCFFLFAETPWKPPVLCSCAITAFGNLLVFRMGDYSKMESAWEGACLPWLKKNAMRKMSHATRGHLFEHRPGLCHRCNGISPSLQYCNEQQGGRFKQFHGWYVKQAFLEKGIFPERFRPFHYPFWLRSCPDTVKEKLKACIHAESAYHAFEQKYSDGFQEAWEAKGPLLREQRHLRRNAAQLQRAIEIQVENEVRHAFGFPNVGEAWKGEQTLFTLLCALFPNHQVIHHYRADWLRGLELDVFIPELNLAFEYQGQQHYMVVPRWGGAAGFEKRCQHDKQKAARCKRRGITLIEIAYHEPLTETHLVARINEKQDGLLLPDSMARTDDK